MYPLKIFAFVLLFFTSVCAQNPRTGGTINPGKGLTVEYIANEGVHIKSGDSQILIDAIHRRYKPAYAFTPEPVLSKIEAARHPYNRISLILVSHYHLDHFHAQSTASHLRNNSAAILASSPQVVDEVRKQSAKDETMNPRLPKIGDKQILEVDFETQKAVTHEFGKVKVKFLGLKHANSKLPAFSGIQNFGHVIEIDGKKLLHIGDADMFAENFSAFELRKEQLDVAIVPYWFTLSRAGRKIIREIFNPKTVVAVHVPPTDQATAMREILGAMPSAVVFSDFGEMLSY